MFNFKAFIKLLEKYKFNFLLKIKQEKKAKNKLINIFSFFKKENKNLINNNIITNVNYGIILFIFLNIIIFIFLFFYLYSIDIMLYLYPDKIIKYLNISIDKEAAGFTFLGAFLPFSHYIFSLKNLYVGVFLDYKKRVFNRTVLLLQFLHKGGIRPLTVSKRKKSIYTKFFLTKISILWKSRIYTYGKTDHINRVLNTKRFVTEIYDPNTFWSTYTHFLKTSIVPRKRSNFLFDSLDDNNLNSLTRFKVRFGNGQLNEFLVDRVAEREKEEKPFNPIIRFMLYKFKLDLAEKMSQYDIVRTRNSFFLTTKSYHSSEDYLFFKNFYFKFKYRVGKAFYKKILNKSGEFYIYYLDLTSDKILFDIYGIFGYIWSFFFNKIKSFFISFFFVIIYYFYYHIIPLFIFLYSLQLSNPFPILIMEFLGYLKLIFSYISGTFVYYYFQKGTYYTIFHSSSFGLLIILVLKVIFFFLLLMIIALLIEDYFNEMEDTLRLPLEVLGVSLILITYAFFVSFNYFIGPLAL